MRLVAKLAFAIFVPCTAGAQAILGTYTAPAAPGRATPVTLVLQKDAQGKITGSLSGNGTSYAVQGELQGSDVAGTLSGGGMRAYFEARRTGTQLRLIMADIGADGKPNYVQARELVLQASEPSPTTAGAPVPSTSGNPFAAAGPPDKFAGTFTSTDVTLKLKKDSAGYTGTIKYRGDEFPATVRGTGETLNGTFKVGPQSYDFTIASAGEGKFVNFSSAGTTYMLARSTDGNTPAGGAATPAAGALGKTPQDMQIVTLLTSTVWCSFSYSGSTTRTSRAVFGVDGVASERENSETVRTVDAGAVWGSNADGKSAKWRIENGQLMLSADGVQWAANTLKIAPNSNGAPIVTVGGREYYRCK